MAPGKKIFGIVLAGGEGKRLMPLTADRAKPAVPFGGQYRLIDFALSNLINSQLRQIVVLTQYKSHSLDRHVSQTWRLDGMLNSYIASVPAQQRLGKRWFSGSADAILQSLNLLARREARHRRRRRRRPRVPHGLQPDDRGAHRLGRAGDRRRDPPADRARRPVRRHRGRPATTRRASRAFREKPTDPIGLPDSPNEVLASMGNYVFDADALIDAVHPRRRAPDSNHDMGGDIIPDFVARGEAAVYDFNRNEVPGSTDRDRYYWRDVGTIDSFFEAHQDLISALPVFNLYNSAWPIFSQELNSPPAKFVRDGRGCARHDIDSIVSLGSVISGAHLERSVLGPWAKVDSGAKVVDSVVFERVIIEPNAFVGRAILDKDVVVAEGARIGVDHERDRARGFTVTESGITVVGKGVHVVP